MITAQAPPDGPNGSPDDGERASRARAVFISDFVHLPVRFDDLVPILMDVDAAWLRALEDPTAVRSPPHGGFERPASESASVSARLTPV